MEEMDIDKLGFFIEEDIFLIPEDAKEILLADKFKDYSDDLPEDHSTASESLSDGSSPEQAQPNEESGASVALTYEGDFEKSLLVIHQDSPLSEELKGFLLKILRAVSYSLKDIALVSASQVSSLPVNTVQQLNPHKILVFGSLNHPIIQQKENNYEISSDGEVEYLFADSLPVIFEDQNLKKNLWNSLQAFFNINK
ncbi:hypothetical protein DN752_01975 [Echinicola strongylocentroti]|uniref:Uncharacterized protein n=2 Tax=Echinicola strongylocentroti TaxID=1795355 RepID=A0A2Z4IDT2_9BACT|nr:hypothetical protein DN752_01975 [Echinicola strongylocentroti]